MPEDQFDELRPPPRALEKGGLEVFRAFVVDGQLDVSLRRAFDEPSAWGLLITDVARHVSRIFALETEMSEDDALEMIRSIFLAEMDSPTDLGSTNAIS